jgi:hypothetical protein
MWNQAHHKAWSKLESRREQSMKELQDALVRFSIVGSEEAAILLKEVQNIKGRVEKLILEHNKKYSPKISMADVDNRNSVVWALTQRFHTQLIDSWCETMRLQEEIDMLADESKRLVLHFTEIANVLMEEEEEEQFLTALKLRVVHQLFENLEIPIDIIYLIVPHSMMHRKTINT